jgi:hypothetical protein
MTRINEINLVNEAISNCKTIEDVFATLELIDNLEKNQPEEVEIITSMRSDMTLIIDELKNQKIVEND